MSRGDFEGCIQARWITPCAQMPTSSGSRARWDRAELEKCETRILAGHAPDPIARGSRGPRRLKQEILP
jgi:hypothetical protein